MSATRFPALRNLLTGGSMSTPPEDDTDADAEAVAAAARAASSAAPRAVNAAAIDAEVERIAAGREKAANDRWHKVMTSDAGVAKPKAAAKLLMSAGGAMSADEVIEILADDLKPTAGAEEQAPADPVAARLAADRARLAGDKNARPDTGAAGGSPASRRGEDGEESADVAKARQSNRASRAAARNKNAEALGGRKANA